MATSTNCKFEGNLISVEGALNIKKNNKTAKFNCIECDHRVKPHSGGGHTNAHFEHIRRNSKCSLSHNSESYKYISPDDPTNETNAIQGQEDYYFRKQRTNQGEFRKRMIKYWGKCCVTGINDYRLLIASHIKPWSECNPEEKLAIDNGLLLAAPIDFLFDNYLLTFNDDGKAKLSKLAQKVYTHFTALDNIRIDRPLNPKQKEFMKHHRDKFAKISTTV